MKKVIIVAFASFLILPVWGEVCFKNYDTCAELEWVKGPYDNFSMKSEFILHLKSKSGHCHTPTNNLHVQAYMYMDNGMHHGTVPFFETGEDLDEAGGRLLFKRVHMAQMEGYWVIQVSLGEGESLEVVELPVEGFL